jgi:hypothetical protein
MSACNILLQRSAVSMLCDAAMYDADGVIGGIGQKCFAMPGLNAIISSLGPAGGAMIFAYELGWRFSSFDQMAARLDVAMREIYEQHEDSFLACRFREVEVHIAGWSESRRAPRAMAMHLCPEGNERWREFCDARGSEEIKTEPFKLIDLAPGVYANPPPLSEQMSAAGLSLDYYGSSPESIDPVLDMLHLMEVQRRKKGEVISGMGAHHLVGGYALLSTVTEAGVSQRVIHKWEEDQTGQPITPLPISWKAWREARMSAHVAALVPDGLSRLQRARMEKKARKGTL